MCELTKEDFEVTLNTVTWGTIIMCDDECRPYPTPVNFGYSDGKIFCHGRASGNKYQFMQKVKKVQFLVVDEYSLIPSYFQLNPSTTDAERKLPCMASQCFVSIKIFAAVKILTNKTEKAVAMNILMHKLQPEGGYEPKIITAETEYIDEVAVFELTIINKSYRQKFCNGYDKDQIENIKTHLTKRGTPNDLRTLEMINKYYKHQNDLIK